MAEGTWTFEIDWDNDGDYADTGEDVSARVRAQSTFTTSHGRRQNRRLSPPAASRARFALINTTGDYYPDNSGSPIFGDVAPGRPVHATVNFNSSDYDVFTGNLFGLDFVADPFEPFVNIECLDVVNTLNRSNVAVDATVGPTIDECIGALLDAVGWSATARDLDVSPITLPVWWAEGDRSAWEELLLLLEVEGPPSVAYVGPDGDFVFKSRHHRLLDSRSTSSQDTFRETGTEPLFSRFSFDPGWRDIINRVEIPLTPLSGSGEEIVHKSTESFLTSNLGTVDVEFTTTTPFPADSAIVSKLDSRAGPATDDPDLWDWSISGTFPNYTLTIEGGDDISGLISSIDYWEISAVPYNRTATSVVTDEDTTSQDAYGIRTWRARSPWHTSEPYAETLAALILNDRKDPRTIAHIEVTNAGTTRYVAGLDKQISDRVTVTDGESSTNGDFYVENIGHTVDQGGKFHTVTLGLESANDPLVAASEVFILDDVTNGVLGTGKLGY